MLFNTEKLQGMPKKIKALARREAEVSMVQQVDMTATFHFWFVMGFEIVSKVQHPLRSRPSHHACSVFHALLASFLLLFSYKPPYDAQCIAYTSVRGLCFICACAVCWAMTGQHDTSCCAATMVKDICVSQSCATVQQIQLLHSNVYLAECHMGLAIRASG